MAKAINIIVEENVPGAPTTLFVDIEKDDGKPINIGQRIPCGRVTKIRITPEDIEKAVEAEDANYPRCSKCGNKTTFGSTGCAYCGHRF